MRRRSCCKLYGDILTYRQPKLFCILTCTDRRRMKSEDTVFFSLAPCFFLFFLFFRQTQHEAFGTDVQSERDITQRIDEDISAQVLLLSVPSCKEIYNVSCWTSLCVCVCAWCERAGEKSRAQEETLSFLIRSIYTDTPECALAETFHKLLFVDKVAWRERDRARRVHEYNNAYWPILYFPAVVLNSLSWCQSMDSDAHVHIVCSFVSVGTRRVPCRARTHAAHKYTHKQAAWKARNCRNEWECVWFGWRSKKYFRFSFKIHFATFVSSSCLCVCVWASANVCVLFATEFHANECT